LFDSIPQAPLLARVAERVSDGRVLALVESYLGQDVLHGLERWTPSGHPPRERLSPLLANLYLHGLGEP
jgi:RNA-directed DNA polymerase